MNKGLLVLLSIAMGTFLSTYSITKFEANNEYKQAYIEQNLPIDATNNLTTYSTHPPALEDKALDSLINGEVSENIAMQSRQEDTHKVASQPIKNSPQSRGGVPSQEQLEEAKEKAKAAALEEKEVQVELLDWWKSARNVFPTGSTAEVTDLYTGKSFMVKRTGGTNHADSEALTKEDTLTIKSIWGGFSWDRRPVIVEINGRRLAASMSAMPHAGLDSAPANAYVKKRSGGYGSGVNYDSVKGNNMNGHFDIHFLNSTRHMDNKRDPEHQAAIIKAAGK